MFCFDKCSCCQKITCSSCIQSHSCYKYSENNDTYNNNNNYSNHEKKVCKKCIKSFVLYKNNRNEPIYSSICSCCDKYPETFQFKINILKDNNEIKICNNSIINIDIVKWKKCLERINNQKTITLHKKKNKFFMYFRSK